MNKTNIFAAILSGNLDSAREQIAQGQTQETPTTASTTNEEEKEEAKVVEVEQQDQEKEKENKTKEKEKTKKKQPTMEDYIKPQCFEIVKSCLNAGVNVLLVGDAGTGKSELAKRVTEDLGLNFYFTNSIIDPYALEGFIDANGNYHKTQFYDFCKNGGVFLIDEIDASDPNALLRLNGAIANGYYDFPNEGRVTLNKNCVFIATANTTGNGATLKYCGRNQLDTATVDRFFMVNVDFDKKVELKITNGNHDLVAFIDDFRNATRNVGLETVVSYRALKTIAKLENVIALDKLYKGVLLKGLDKGDYSLIQNKMHVQTNAYYDAFTKIAGRKKDGEQASL